MNIKFKNYESIHFLRKFRSLFNFPDWSMVAERNKEFEYVVNAQHYSSEEQVLKDVKIFKFDLNNKFLERLDVENVKWFLTDFGI